MAKHNPSDHTPTQPETGLVPTGELLHLSTADIIPSRTNPRHLFDPKPLEALKKNIRDHGVLVPITVYRPKGQRKYSILDGERRYRCCIELEKEGHSLKLPANVVVPPSKIAGVLYMFSIHNFREQWELMPTALALRSVMERLEETDTLQLSKLTGLSEAQIDRCKILLAYKEEYQNMSLDPNPKTRIPSNFWIEVYPVLDLCQKELPLLTRRLSRDGIIHALVDKYRARKIKSVIHFRRIMEAYEHADQQRREVLARLEAYITNRDLETREAFDEFVVESRRIRTALEACEAFLKELHRLKLDYTVERQELRKALQDVFDFTKQLLEKLEGTDPPPEEEEDGI